MRVQEHRPTSRKEGLQLLKSLRQNTQILTVQNALWMRYEGIIVLHYSLFYSAQNPWLEQLKPTPFDIPTRISVFWAIRALFFP